MQAAAPDPAAALVAVAAGPERSSPARPAAVGARASAPADIVRMPAAAAPAPAGPAALLTSAAGPARAPAPTAPARGKGGAQAGLLAGAAAAHLSSAEHAGSARPYDPLPDLLRLQRGRGSLGGAGADGECDLGAVLSRRSGGLGVAAVAACFR